MTVDEKKDGSAPARALRKELFSDELIDELMGRVGEDGVTSTGQGGFLPELVKAVLERGMDAELTSHLGLLLVTLGTEWLRRADSRHVPSLIRPAPARL